MPQQLTVPLATSAQVWLWPATTATAVEMPDTTTALNALLLPLTPFPSSPEPLEPQHRSVPSAMSAHACVVPLATAIALVTPWTAIGVGVLIVPPASVPPSPSWPRLS